MFKVKLIAHTPDPEYLVAGTAKLCYSGADIDTVMSGLDDEKVTSFVGMLADIGHESPIEHVSFTFGIDGVSRSLLAQITRHRMASYMVQSQRYVRERDFEYVTPPAIEQNPEALAEFQRAMEEDMKSYEKIAAILKEDHVKELMAEGKSEKEAKRLAEKMAIEDARYVLPNACDTKMMVTMNARSLLNFFHHRCCNRAQWEIRALAEEMFRLCYEVAPHIFAAAGPSCVAGKCPEGKMSCGKMAEMREKYQKIKEEAGDR